LTLHKLIGIDIGGTKCAVVLGDENGTVLKKARFETTSCKETLERILTEVSGMAEEAVAIGISCGGPLDEKRGVIQAPPNLPDWDNIPIKELLEKRFGIPVALRNDANACALAEWMYGAGRGTQNMVFMTFGTGLGAGLILNGRLYGGTTGMAGEVGHWRLDAHGPSGYGKCGSFEGFCSGTGLWELGRGLAREYLQRGETPSFIPSKDCNAFTVAEMAEAARKKDPCACEAFRICGDKLGQGLSLMADILDPEVIVIGSVYARCKDLLEAPALARMEKECLPQTLKTCKIKPAELGEKIGDVAALAVAASVLQ
jgi:glucokinase